MGIARLNPELPRIAEACPEILCYVQLRESAAVLLAELPKLFPPEKIKSEADVLGWELAGRYHMAEMRPHDALAIFSGLYQQMLCAQETHGKWIHKGMPLVWIRDCYAHLGFAALAKRYMMLTLCEDAVRDKGQVPPATTGSYFRAVWHHGLSDEEVCRYARKMHAQHQTAEEQGRPECALFPEAVLQELDQDWMTEFPSPQEASLYPLNRRYADFLFSQEKDGGKTLERLAQYLLSVMPGWRTSRGERTVSSELDVVCSMMGLEADFRSELGRYFVCECKDWDTPADFTAMTKFCRVLDSVQARFGILFSREGISGADETKHAEREQLKVFHDRGIIIVVVDGDDIKRVINGANFISLLRTKYERVRLDLLPSRQRRAPVAE